MSPSSKKPPAEKKAPKKSPKKKEITQEELIKEFFLKNPNRDIEHRESKPWLEKEHLRRTGEVFADPDRGIRKLSQDGFLIKIAKGVYRYDTARGPQGGVKRDKGFTPAQKEEIKRRDGYKCVVCGKGEKDGVELQVDHIKPVDRAGKSTLANGQTLCGMHNYRKKNYSQSETAKKMFIRLHEQARSLGDETIVDFSRAILEVYEEHDINGHIEWERPKK